MVQKKHRVRISNLESRNTKQIQKNKIQTISGRIMEGHKRYDLEDRTLQFERKVAELVNIAPKTIPNVEYCKQVIRSSGSVGANYIEANEALSRKDFLMRIKICRKESKESRYWLNLITCKSDPQLSQEKLVQESTELMKIYGAILEKTK